MTRRLIRTSGAWAADRLSPLTPAGVRSRRARTLAGFIAPGVPDTRPQCPAVPINQAVPRLHALGRVLTGMRFMVTLFLVDAAPVLRVIHPQRSDHRDRITCRHHQADEAVWFYSSWGQPLRPARDIRAAAAAIAAALTPKPGVKFGA